MAIGALKMYMDMDIADVLRGLFGHTIGLNTALFFEELRNYGQEEVFKRYPERTFYQYIRNLIEAGYVVKDSKGIYRVIENEKEPIRLIKAR